MEFALESRLGEHAPRANEPDLTLCTGSPVIKDEQVDALKGCDQARQTAFATRLREICEQAGCPLVEDGKAVAAGLVAERTGKPGLACAGRDSVTMPGVRSSRF